MSAGPGVLVGQGLTRRFGEHTAVRPFDLEVGPGGVTGLLGPNGSGKSTYLRMLLGLVRPDGGRASVDDVELEGDGVGIRRRVTYMPGEVHVYGEMRGGEHLAWLLRGRGREALERAQRIGEELGLPLERRVRGYSHGMKRQLFFAAAMAPDVRVRVLDEPTEGLDPTKRGEVLRRLRADVERNGTTILFSSHHLGEVERLCDRVLFVRQGELLDEESARLLLQRARRSLRLTFPEDADPERLRAALEPLGAEVRLDGHRATLFPQADADPVDLLRGVVTRGDLPAPASLVYGEMSLQDLYRELYGVEGV